MHELGIVYEVIKIVDGFVKENNIEKVDTIVLEVGRLSQAIPRFLEECYPAAVDGTIYENTKLKIEIVEAIGNCNVCNENYNIIENRKVCPKCSNENYTLTSGTDFNIKEIIAF